MFSIFVSFSAGLLRRDGDHCGVSQILGAQNFQGHLSAPGLANVRSNHGGAGG